MSLSVLSFNLLFYKLKTCHWNKTFCRGVESQNQAARVKISGTQWPLVCCTVTWERRKTSFDLFYFQFDFSFWKWYWTRKVLTWDAVRKMFRYCLCEDRLTQEVRKIKLFLNQSNKKKHFITKGAAFLNHTFNQVVCWSVQSDCISPEEAVSKDSADFSLWVQPQFLSVGEVLLACRNNTTLII